MKRVKYKLRDTRENKYAHNRSSDQPFRKVLDQIQVIDLDCDTDEEAIKMFADNRNISRYEIYKISDLVKVVEKEKSERLTEEDLSHMVQRSTRKHIQNNLRNGRYKR